MSQETPETPETSATAQDSIDIAHLAGLARLALRDNASVEVAADLQRFTVVDPAAEVCRGMTRTRPAPNR